MYFIIIIITLFILSWPIVYYTVLNYLLKAVASLIKLMLIKVNFLKTS